MRTTEILIAVKDGGLLSVSRNSADHYALRKQCLRLRVNGLLHLLHRTPTKFYYVDSKDLDMPELVNKLNEDLKANGEPYPAI